MQGLELQATSGLQKSIIKTKNLERNKDKLDRSQEDNSNEIPNFLYFSQSEPNLTNIHTPFYLNQKSNPYYTPIRGE